MNSTPLTGPLQIAGMLRAGRLPHLVTILAATRAVDSYGEKIATWAAVEGLTNLPAYVGERGSGRETQRRTAELSIVDEGLSVMLGHQPSITLLHAVLYEDEQYDIEGVRHDADGGWTALTIRHREVD